MTSENDRRSILSLRIEVIAMGKFFFMIVTIIIILLLISGKAA